MTARTRTEASRSKARSDEPPGAVCSRAQSQRFDSPNRSTRSDSGRRSNTISPEVRDALVKLATLDIDEKQRSSIASRSASHILGLEG